MCLFCAYDYRLRSKPHHLVKCSMLFYQIRTKTRLFGHQALVESKSTSRPMCVRILVLDMANDVNNTHVSLSLNLKIETNV